MRQSRHMQTHKGYQLQFASNLRDHILGTSHTITLPSSAAPLNMQFGTVGHVYCYTHSLLVLSVSLRKITRSFQKGYNCNYVMFDMLYICSIIIVQHCSTWPQSFRLKSRQNSKAYKLDKSSCSYVFENQTTKANTSLVESNLPSVRLSMHISDATKPLPTPTGRTSIFYRYGLKEKKSWSVANQLLRYGENTCHCNNEGRSRSILNLLLR
jgi:hypothetical protein